MGCLAPQRSHKGSLQGVDQECYVPHGELLFPIEAKEDGRATMNVGFIDLHLLECIQEQHISEGAIIDENSFDHAIGG